LLEKLWSAKAIALHVVFTVTCSGALFFLCELIHVYRTHHEKDFFIPVSGCCGLVVALAVGVRHAYPLEPLPGLPRSLGLQYQHVAFTLTAVTTAIGFLLPQQFTEWWFAPFALFFGWFHIRYLMWFPHVQAHGDHSEEFNFAAVFPRPLRPAVSCIGAIAHNLSMMVAPGFVSLRVADAETGQAQSIVYDPTTAAFGDHNVTWTPSKGVLPDDQPGSKEYNARREKALALLDQNISSLLAPERVSRPLSGATEDRGGSVGTELSSALSSRLSDLSTLQSLGGGERQAANGERGLTPLRSRGSGLASTSAGNSPDRGNTVSPGQPVAGVQGGGGGGGAGSPGAPGTQGGSGSPAAEDQKDRDE